MEEKLKKLVKDSKEGTWLVIAVSIAMNVLCIISRKNFLEYFDTCWVSIIYMLGLLAGLALYKEEKYKQGAELIQWVALGNMIVYFVKFVTAFIVTRLIEFSIITFLIEMIIPIILVVEALKVLNVTDKKDIPLGTTAIPIAVIVLIAVTKIISIVVPAITTSSISIS